VISDIDSQVLGVPGVDIDSIRLDKGHLERLKDAETQRMRMSN
jgi:hypothetical protein